MTENREIAKLEKREKKVISKLDNLTEKGAMILEAINAGRLTTGGWVEQTKALYLNSKVIVKLEDELKTIRTMQEALEKAKAQAEVKPATI